MSQRHHHHIPRDPLEALDSPAWLLIVDERRLPAHGRACNADARARTGRLRQCARLRLRRRAQMEVWRGHRLVPAASESRPDVADCDAIHSKSRPDVADCDAMHSESRHDVADCAYSAPSELGESVGGAVPATSIVMPTEPSSCRRRPVDAAREHDGYSYPIWFVRQSARRTARHGMARPQAQAHAPRKSAQPFGGVRLLLLLYGRCKRTNHGAPIWRVCAHVQLNGWVRG